MQKLGKVFYGWWMVLVSATLNLLSGASFFYGFSVFFNPIRETFNWSFAQTSFAFTFQRLESGLLSPVAGFFVDRLNPRTLMMAGWAVFGLSFILMSRINTLWTFYAVFIVMSIGLSFGSFTVPNTAVARWFNKKRSRALAFIYVGYGLSGTLVPLLALAITRFGWRDTLLWLGIGLLLVGVSLSMLIRDRPERYGWLPDGVGPNGEADPPLPATGVKKGQGAPAATGFTLREALRTPAFWLIGLSSLFQLIGTSAVMVHQVPYLENVGFSRETASLVVAGVTVCSLIGRLGFGVLGDRANKRYLMAGAMALQAIGTLIFAFVNVDRAWLLIPFLLTYAPGYGGPIPLRPALQADYFGLKSIGTIMGLMSTIGMLGGLVSPVFTGWIRDTTGSYQLAWLIMAGATLPAVLCVLLARPPKAGSSVSHSSAPEIPVTLH